MTNAASEFPPETQDSTKWRKDRTLIRKGFKELQYLPRSRCGWNATLSALAYSARRLIDGQADLPTWAAMHACRPSRRCAELGDDRLVLWHGTSARRAEKIRELGLFHKRGVWAATDPGIAHGFTRGRSQAFQAGSAMIVLVISKDEWDSKADRDADNIVRFRQNVPPECIEYIIWSDRIEFVGLGAAKRPKPWGVAKFKRSEGKWIPRSHPPVRLDGRRSYSSLQEWLDMSIRRILASLGSASAIEVFSSLYATINPWSALEHNDIFSAMERLCGRPRTMRRGLRLFSLAD